MRALGMLPMALGLFRHKRLSIKMENLTLERIKQLKAIIDKSEIEGVLV